MPIHPHEFDIIVIGGGHAGAEAAWAGANLGARVALVTLDPSKTGAMSCNPAIGGLAKGQMVREIDALGGLMGLAADATGIQFRMLNLSKGSAVHGPRCQSDKYRYAREVQRLLTTRENITCFAGACEDILLDTAKAGDAKVRGILLHPSPNRPSCSPSTTSDIRYPDEPVELFAPAVVLTTGTFMRGLMHTGERQTPGGRVNEAAAVGISGALVRLGFELGRLKTGTPPRLAAESLDLASLEAQPGDDEPCPFSDLTDPAAFPVIEQRPCHLTHTNHAIHELIRANLHRAPMYNGQIQTAGPRYCPSIEDKVVRFADRTSHHVFLEPESLETNEIYCNGISTSLPADVQEVIVRSMPGCGQAKILRHGYAVEYDMVWPHQIDATCMTKRLPGLFLAGQINGTSGYEEAAGQGLIAGLNAVRYTRGQSEVRLGRSEAYIGVMLDDLVTKTPREPYRMFTSRAEHRLLLRADNADTRLTERGRRWGVVDDRRHGVFERRQEQIATLKAMMAQTKVDGQLMTAWARRPAVNAKMLLEHLKQTNPAAASLRMDVAVTVLSDLQYEGYIQRQQREVEKLARQEMAALPASFDFMRVQGLGREAQGALDKFRPTTLGQAARLSGVTPADLMLLTVALGR
jgi:tRNA uridine 5-carboxymethylaminomethyl modification enzyme